MNRDVKTERLSQLSMKLKKKLLNQILMISSSLDLVKTHKRIFSFPSVL